MDEHCPKWFINYQVGFANLVYSLPNREQLSVKGMLVEAAQLGNQFTNYGFPGMSFLELVTTSPKQCMLAKLTWC